MSSIRGVAVLRWRSTIEQYVVDWKVNSSRTVDTSDATNIKQV